MENDFFKFIVEPSKENFLAARDTVVRHPDYEPYSDDLDVLEKLLDDGKYEEAAKFNNINLFLSARAHLYKKYANEKLGNEKDAKMEHILAMGIIDGIEMTGDGTLENPYWVLRVSDERDLMLLLEENFASQALSHQNGRSYDIITTVSGKTIYFDITDCYNRMTATYGSGKGSTVMQELEKMANKPSAKKWWQFWK